MTLFLEYWPVILLFFGVAICYASVGFGGGSSYLAILTLFGFQFSFLRALALLCNITVVTNGTFQFHKAGFLDLRKTAPLVFASVPLAFLGGRVPIMEQVFFIFLGITLIVAALFMWLQKSFKREETELEASKTTWFTNAIIGGSIGFVSGMVGIGGGIFLAPLLYLMSWGSPRKIAATSSFFILVNSLAGLLGQASNPSFEMNWTLAIALMISVGFGGLIGSYLGVVKLKPTWIRVATSVLIFYAGGNILLKYLF